MHNDICLSILELRFSMKKAAVVMHGRGNIFSNDAMFVNRLDRERNNCQFCWEFEWFRHKDSDFVATPVAAL